MVAFRQMRFTRVATGLPRPFRIHRKIRLSSIIFRRGISDHGLLSSRVTRELLRRTETVFAAREEPGRNAMNHALTAEDLYTEMKRMPAADPAPLCAVRQACAQPCRGPQPDVLCPSLARLQAKPRQQGVTVWFAVRPDGSRFTALSPGSSRNALGMPI